MTREAELAMHRVAALLVAAAALVGVVVPEASAAPNPDDGVERLALPGAVSADALTVGAYAIWIVDRAGGQVLRFDPHTEEVVGTVPVTGPVDVAWREGFVWVTSAAGVVQIDEESGTVLGTVPLAELGMAAPGAVAVGGGSVWVVGTAEGVVVRIDQEDRSVTATIDVGVGPTDLAYSSGVWVANSGDGTISRIDPSTDEVRTISGRKLAPGPIAADATTGTWTQGTGRPGSLCRLGKQRAHDVCTKVAAAPVALASGFALVWMAGDDGTAYAVSAVRPSSKRVFPTGADPLADIATDGALGWGVDSTPGAPALLRIGS
jgi:DNA-binding beta-propeller fold protein YncE